MVCLGRVRFGRRVMASQGMFWYAEVRQVGLGLARCVEVCCGSAGMARLVTLRLGVVWQAR